MASLWYCINPKLHRDSGWNVDGDRCNDVDCVRKAAEVARRRRVFVQRSEQSCPDNVSAIAQTRQLGDFYAELEVRHAATRIRELQIESDAEDIADADKDNDEPPAKKQRRDPEHVYALIATARY